MKPVLHDAVTLCHFAAISRLDILEKRHSNRPEPRWTQSVCEEIQKAASQAIYGNRVLQATWLGNPVTPTHTETTQIALIRTALNPKENKPCDNLGEAESIYFATKLQGQFATDDNEAYEFAARRLGSENVMDTVDILREAVAMYELTANDADQVDKSIEASGRRLRREHDRQRGPSYYQ